MSRSIAVKPSHRMKRSRDFARLRHQGLSKAGRFVVISSLHDPELEPRFLAGVITSKRTGKAVARNRLRRRLRAIINEFSPTIRPGTMLVTIARQRAAKASYQALREDWVRQARRLDVLTLQPTEACAVR